MKRMSITVPLNPIANGDIAWLFQSGLTIWKNIGYNSIIFFSSIAGIDLDLYEASDIDGAGRYRKIWNITVPGIMPTFVTLLLINVGFMLSNGFDQFYVFMNPMVQRKIEVLDYYVYKVGMQNNDVPVSTALSMAKTVVSVTMLFFTNWISKKVRGQSVL
jgi:ABC-type polysaccharide transport system permease subunit